MSLSASLSDMSMSLGDPAGELGRLARDLAARSKALGVLADLHKSMVDIPLGPGTAGQAHAFGMYVSLEKLSNTLRSAADNYATAAAQLSYYRDWLGGLAYRANQDAWELIFVRIARIQHEMDAAAQKPPSASDQSHVRPPGVPPPNPTPRTFPTLEEQRRTVCPNCHQQVQKADATLLQRAGGFGTGPGGQMTAADYRKLKEWLDASSSQGR
jgi:hypothetical protein